MRNTTEIEAKKYPQSGRIKNKGGYFTSDDGLVEGIGEVGLNFVKAYEESIKSRTQKTRDWVEKLRFLGIKASHPDDGWHDRENMRFGLCYPDFNDGVNVGDMVALGNFEKFVVVVVCDKSGWFSTSYKYRSTIH